MGFDATTGLIVILAIAFAVLIGGFLIRPLFKRPREDEGVNASTELSAHDEGHVGRVEQSDAENRQEAV